MIIEMWRDFYKDYCGKKIMKIGIALHHKPIKIGY